MKTYLLAISLLFSASLLGQKEIINQFTKYKNTQFQEKVYIHTDKPYYFAGDTIWLKGYLMSAEEHLADKAHSQFLYVELVNCGLQEISRIKLKRNKYGFSGYIPISSREVEGNYLLRAYTYWMQNNNENFYFEKIIPIYQSAHLSLSPKISFSSNDVENTIDFQLKINHVDNRIPRELFSNISTLDSGHIKNNKLVQFDKSGILMHSFSNKMSPSYIQVRPRHKNSNYDLQIDIATPIQKLSPHLHFFPEGGNWITGRQQRIAFRAIAQNGKGLDVTGNIYNQKDEYVTSFRSTHQGMGTVMFIPKEEETYYARYQTKDSEEHSCQIPISREYDIALQSTIKHNQIIYKVVTNSGKSDTSELLLIIHQRGIVQGIQKVSKNWQGYFPISQLKEGIVHSFICDKKGNLITERMNFIFPNEDFPVVLKSNASNSGKREKIEIKLYLDHMTDSLTGNFSLSITDNQGVHYPKWGNPINSHLLLTSDLKDYVENPSWYLDTLVRQDLRFRAMETLLMTQTWSRFKINDLLNKTITPYNPFFLELKQSIAGKVTKLFSKKAIEKAKVLLVGSQRHQRYFMETDSCGHFIFQNLDFNDTTSLFIQGLNMKGRKSINIQIQEDSLRPLLSYRHFEYLRPIANIEKKETNHVEKNKEADLSFYVDKKNGEKVYQLEEVIVKRSNPFHHIIDNAEQQANDVYDQNRLKGSGIKSIRQWIEKQPLLEIVYNDDLGYEVVQPRTSKRYDRDQIAKKDTTMLFVNTIEGKLYQLEQLPFNRVEKIFLVKDYIPELSQRLDTHNIPLAIFIAVKGEYYPNEYERRSDNMLITPLGYQIDRHFYHPDYSAHELKNDTEPDYRSTLYWNPNVNLTRQAKTFSFYTGDKSNSYTIRLEGILNNGKVINKEWIINSK